MLQSNLMLKKVLFLSLGAILLSGCTLSSSTNTPPKNANLDTLNQSPTSTITPTAVQFNTMKKPEELLNLKAGQKMSATIKTSLGDIAVELYPDKTPITVGNFVGLSEGSQPWKDPKTGQEVTDKPLYSGTIFHRVIDQFMIQGGDPLGKGFGGPGYQFPDEISSELRFDAPGVLAMANSGPSTNGSQFFITQVATPWLNGKHTIFGKVTKGMDIVDKIAKVAKDANDKPTKDVIIEKIVIERK